MKGNPIYNPVGRRLAAVGFSVLLLAALTGCEGGHAGAASAPPAPQVSAAPVLVKTISHWDSFNGRIEAVERVDLRPRVSGYIEQVNYVEGQEVRKGDVLFTIDARSYQAEYDRARAELSRARSQAALARNDAARAQRLAAKQAIAAEIVEQRRAAADQADAQVQAAQAALDGAQLNLEFTQVRAPIDGRAGRALVTAGNLVTAGDAASVLTTLISLDTVHLYFEADEATFLRYAQMARTGERPSERDQRLPVRVGLSGEEGYPHGGWVDFLESQVSRSTGTIAMRAVLDNRDRRFTPGLFARVSLLGSGRYQAMLIDDRAVLTDQDRKYVYVVANDGTAQRRDVSLGRSAEGLRVVERGLAPGDRVIVNGVQKVFMPGMPVEAASVTMQPLSTASR